MTTGWKRPDGCECGVEEPDEFCPHHGRSHKELVAEVARLRGTVEKERDNALWEAANLANDNVQLQEVVGRLRGVLDPGQANVDAIAAAIPDRVLASTRTATWAVIVAQVARADSPPAPRKHHNRCEAEVDHAHDCATATRLAQLTAFAEAVRDEWQCTCPKPGDPQPDPLTPEEHDPPAVECWACLAQQALEGPRG